MVKSRTSLRKSMRIKMNETTPDSVIASPRKKMKFSGDSSKVSPSGVKTRQMVKVEDVKKKVVGKNVIEKGKKKVARSLRAKTNLKKLKKNTVIVDEVYAELLKKSSVEEKEENKRPPATIIMDGEFYFLPQDRLPARISYEGFTPDVVLDNIRRVLSPKQLELFSKTCFGHFLKVKPLKLQLNLIHSLLVREIKQGNEYELWVEVSGRSLRFGLGEFGLVTGLNISSNEIKSKYKLKNPSLRKKVFGIDKRVTKGLLEQVFNCGNFPSDEDAVRLAVLYFIECYLLSGSEVKNVRDTMFDIVESGGYESYGWGKEVFFETVQELKSRLNAWKQDVGARKKWFYVAMKYYVLAFQIWFYECCPHVEGRFANRVGDEVPRILRWSCTDSKSFDELRTELFSYDASTLGLRNLVPTKDESEALDLGGFFDDSVGEDMVGSIRTPKPSGASSSIANKEVDSLLKAMNTIICNQSKLFKKFSDFEMKFELLRKDVNDVVNLVKESASEKKVVDIGNDGGVGGVRGDNDGDDGNNGGDDGNNDGVGANCEVDKEVHVADDIGEVYKDGTVSDFDFGFNKITDDLSQFENLDHSLGFGGVNPTIGSVIKEDVSVENVNVQDEKSVDAFDFVFQKVVVTSLKSDDIDSDFMSKLENAEKDIVSAVKPEKKSAEEDDNVEEVVKEGEQEKTKETDVKDAVFITPQQGKRKKRHDLFSRSPYDVYFGSSSEKAQGSIVRLPCLKCPLDDEIGASNSRYVSSSGFIDWLYSGLIKGRNGSDKRIYGEEDDVIDPPIELGVVSIQSKTWFYHLANPGQLFESSHIDVIFYYLRKKGKFLGDSLPFRFTTTDNYFDQKIQNLYGKFKDSERNVDLLQFGDNIVGYITGHIMRCSKKWCFVDHILFPIHIPNTALGGRLDHWVLGQFSFKERCIFVYDSLSSKRNENGVVSIVDAYSVLLPHFFKICSLYVGRKDIDFSSAAYSGINETDPIEIKFVSGLPTQQNNDCGLFVASFAEYFIMGKKIPAKNFDVKSHRLRLAVLLWMHGMSKQYENVSSEEESPVRWLD